MRVTFNAIFRDGQLDLERTATALQEAQRQVSSGRRVQTAADDPTAAASAIADHAEIGGLDDYARAAGSAGSRLALADSVLTDIIEKITAAKTTVMAARVSTISQQQRDALADDLRGTRDAVFSNLNTQFQGSYLFSGTAAKTAPYTMAAGVVSGYAGDSAAMTVDVDRGRSVAVSFDGSSIVSDGSDPDLFARFDALIDAVANNDNDAIATGMAALDRAFGRAVRAQSQIGASERVLDDERLRVEALRQASAARLSKALDANMAEAITRMTQAETAYRAALGAVSQTARLSLMDYLQ